MDENHAIMIPVHMDMKVSGLGTISQQEKQFAKPGYSAKIFKGVYFLTEMKIISC